MNVLSLFDGMGGARVALQALGVRPSNYWAFEINGPSIAVAQANFPDIVELGNIRSFNTDELLKVKWDLVIFGSPCTDLSVGKKGRKSLAGESSGLFFFAADIVRALRPTHFLMENVASMSDESKAIISKTLGVQPIQINSRYFTGQNRERLYWLNWTANPMPTVPVPFVSKLFSDVGIIDGLLHSEAAVDYMYRRVSNGRSHWDFKHHSDTRDESSACVVANFKKGVPYNVLIDRRLSSSPIVRKFHPVECERLQGFPDYYSGAVACTHRYEMLGNAFTVPVITHLLASII